MFLIVPVLTSGIIVDFLNGMDFTEKDCKWYGSVIWVVELVCRNVASEWLHRWKSVPAGSTRARDEGHSTIFNNAWESQSSKINNILVHEINSFWEQCFLFLLNWKDSVTDSRILSCVQVAYILGYIFVKFTMLFCIASTKIPIHLNTPLSLNFSRFLWKMRFSIIREKIINSVLQLGSSARQKSVNQGSKKSEWRL